MSQAPKHSQSYDTTNNREPKHKLSLERPEPFQSLPPVQVQQVMQTQPVS